LATQTDHGKSPSILSDHDTSNAQVGPPPSYALATNGGISSGESSATTSAPLVNSETNHPSPASSILVNQNESNGEVDFPPPSYETVMGGSDRQHIAHRTPDLSTSDSKTNSLTSDSKIDPSISDIKTAPLKLNSQIDSSLSNSKIIPSTSSDGNGT